jgi:HEAT repeats
MVHKVPFIVAELGADADPFTLHLYTVRRDGAAGYPLLGELVPSPSPGERLAAVAILQVFATPEYLPFLVRLVRSDRPFVGYHATKALHFAVGSLDANSYPQLMDAIQPRIGTPICLCH